MAFVNKASGRENIKIEIKNDFVEEMESKNVEENDGLSEGEIEDVEMSSVHEDENTVTTVTKTLFSDQNILSRQIEVRTVFFFVDVVSTNV